jgi:tripartite-type tricarboxylate transporter receptor subunit TctC
VTVHWRVAHAALSMLLVAAGAPAQTYPVRPVRVVVPQQAGGSADMTLRLQLPYVERRLGRNFIVDNRPGATGVIAVQIVASAPPDGYTLLYNASNMLITQTIQPAAPYKVLRDFVPITVTAASLGNLVVVNPAVSARSMQELIALAKERAGRNDPLRYGSQGNGSGQHLLVEMFNLRAGTSLMHVPYKGVPAIINALLAGEVDVLFINPIAVLPHVKSGRVRVLGFTGATRFEALPDVPTLTEAGVRDMENPQASWHGWFAPAGTPDSVVMMIYSAVQEALRESPVRGAIEAGGYRVITDQTPAEFRNYVNEELNRLAEVAHAAKIGSQ